MPGGLVQIVNYSNQDLTLTGNPQITFFNIVFRRYTNFGKKTVILSFDNNVNFGILSTITIPKFNGDLLSKLALRIKLPTLNINDLISYVTNNINNLNNNNNNIYLEYYKFYLQFINNLKNIITFFFNSNNKVNYIKKLDSFITDKINKYEFEQIFTIINFFYNNNFLVESSINVNNFTNCTLYKIINNELIFIYTNLNETTTSYDLFKFTIDKNIEILFSLNKILFNKILNLISNKNIIEIQWIDKIAIGIINSIEFYIGSNKIDTLTDTYISYYFELYCKNKELFNEMIGFNNSMLNKSSTVIDEQYVYLPLPFWFNNNYGLALPLICLQFNTVQLKINFKKLIECIKFNINDIYINSISNIQDLIVKYLSANINNIMSSNLEITMIAEYIFLDTSERNKFAQSRHEYLITQTQEIDFNIYDNNNNTFLLDFYHCCKDIHWNLVKPFNIYDIFDKTINFYNYKIINNANNIYDINSNYLLKYYNILYNPYKLFNLNDFIYGISIFNSNVITMEQDNIILNNVIKTFDKLISNLSGISNTKLSYNGTILINETTNFFNYLHPYNYYNSTPEIGNNIYSFSLNPTEIQPSGSSNLSRIPSFTITLSYNNILFNNKNNYKLIVNVTNYNILRLIGGIAGIAYSY